MTPALRGLFVGVDWGLRDATFVTERPLFPKVPQVRPVSHGVEPFLTVPFSQKMLTFDATAVSVEPKPSFDLSTMITEMMKKMESDLTRSILGSSRYIEPRKETLSALLDETCEVIGASLRQCENPVPDAAPRAVQAQLTETLRLMWVYEQVDDLFHDLSISPSETLRDVEERLYREFRTSSTRDRLGAKVYQRACDRIAELKRLSESVRSKITHDDGERVYDRGFYEQVINTAFTAALRLEAHFEDRLYGDEAA